MMPSKIVFPISLGIAYTILASLVLMLPMWLSGGVHNELYVIIVLLTHLPVTPLFLIGDWSNGFDEAPWTIYLITLIAWMSIGLIVGFYLDQKSEPEEIT